MKSEMAIKLLITDFDGTIVETFEANFKAYQKSFKLCGLELSEAHYRDCFGLRFAEFMDKMDIVNIQTRQFIKKNKAEIYPDYFSFLKVNKSLLNFIASFKATGGKTALASTARKENLMNVLTYIQAIDIFDLILAGEDVDKGKPDPEIYQKALQYFAINANEALIFEDSIVGLEAATRAGVSYIHIKSDFYGD